MEGAAASQTSSVPDPDTRRIHAEKGERDFFSSTTMERAHRSHSTNETAPPTWQVAYRPRLTAAITEALEHLQIRCPYEAHDAERVLRWLKNHPLHQFDLYPFKEFVSARLANIR